MTSATLGVVGLLLASIAMPGPNNLIVMRAAARGGWRAATRAGLGIVAGTVALLLLAFAGLGTTVAGLPGLAPVITAAGALYLAALGGSWIARGGRAPTGVAPGGGSPRAAGLFAFQFLNPKAWVTVLMAVSAARGAFEPGSALAWLLALAVAVSVPSLALWSSCGVALTRRLERPCFRAWFDRAAGVLLVASALMLAASTWSGGTS